MSRDALSLSDYLGHIAEAIARIERYTANTTEASFVSDSASLVQDAVIRNLEVIGEAGNNIAKRYPEFLAAHREIPIGAAYQMRNALAHGYHKLDMRVIWATIQDHLPQMAKQIEAVRAQYSSEGLGAGETPLQRNPVGDDFGL